MSERKICIYDTATSGQLLLFVFEDTVWEALAPPPVCSSFVDADTDEAFFPVNQVHQESRKSMKKLEISLSEQRH
jgi:hypothetical protein